MDLKPKLVIKDKGASTPMAHLEQAIISLRWKSSIDFDLMAFGKKKDGTEFSVFTKNLGGNQGDLMAFPFMQMANDEGIGGKVEAAGNEETITIAKIDSSVEHLDIIALNYTDASQKKASSFSQYDVSINVIDQNGQCLVQGQLNDTTPGCVAHLCTIKSSAVSAEFTNVNKVYGLDGLLAAIPGTKALFG